MFFSLIYLRLLLYDAQWKGNVRHFEWYIIIIYKVIGKRMGNKVYVHEYCEMRYSKFAGDE